MKRIAPILLIYLTTVVGLTLFQPGGVRAQSTSTTPNPYIDALATHVALGLML